MIVTNENDVNSVFMVVANDVVDALSERGL